MLPGPGPYACLYCGYVGTADEMVPEMTFKPGSFRMDRFLCPRCSKWAFEITVVRPLQKEEAEFRTWFHKVFG